MILDMKTKKQLDDYKQGIRSAKQGLENLDPRNKDYTLGYENAKARMQLKEMGISNGV